jgi:hypothetical protein
MRCAQGLHWILIDRFAPLLFAALNLESIHG